MSNNYLLSKYVKPIFIIKVTLLKDKAQVKISSECYEQISDARKFLCTREGIQQISTTMFADDTYQYDIEILDLVYYQ